MNQIAPLLCPERVLLDLETGSKQRLFEYLGQHMAGEVGVDSGLVVDSLLARERLGSTGLGQGMAIPHGRIKGIKSACGVLVRLRTALDFSAPDQMPVKLLFVLFVPTRATDQHLQILSELAQLFADRGMRDALLNSPDRMSALTLLQNWRAWSEA